MYLTAELPLNPRPQTLYHDKDPKAVNTEAPGQLWKVPYLRAVVGFGVHGLWLKVWGFMVLIRFLKQGSHW